MNQSGLGADTYLNLSARIQQHYFDLLVSTIEIQPSWHVLDLGCGTGNGTLKLFEKVGQQGHVVGIDPIEERIVKAKANFGAPNISYHVGYGRDASKFGCHFDLVVAGTVMHWLSENEKIKTFESVYKSLKPNGIFLFNCMEEKNSANILKFLDFFDDDSLKDTLLSSLFCPSKNQFETLGKNSGFTKSKIDQVTVSIPYESKEAAIQHVSASWHVLPYETIHSKLLDVIHNENNNIDFLYDEEGKPCFKNKYHFVTCYK